MKIRLRESWFEPSWVIGCVHRKTTNRSRQQSLPLPLSNDCSSHSNERTSPPHPPPPRAPPPSPASIEWSSCLTWSHHLWIFLINVWQVLSFDSKLTRSRKLASLVLKSLGLESIIRRLRKRNLSAKAQKCQTEESPTEVQTKPESLAGSNTTWSSQTGFKFKLGTKNNH